MPARICVPTIIAITCSLRSPAAKMPRQLGVLDRSLERASAR